MLADAVLRARGGAAGEFPEEKIAGAPVRTAPADRERPVVHRHVGRCDERSSAGAGLLLHDVDLGHRILVEPCPEEARPRRAVLRRPEFDRPDAPRWGVERRQRTRRPRPDIDDHVEATRARRGIRRLDRTAVDEALGVVQ